MRPAQAQYITSSAGRKKAVIIPINECQRLLEDLHDLKVIIERQDEENISFEDVMKHLAGPAV